MNEVCEKSKDILIQKYEALCRLEINNFKYILENNFYKNSDEAIINNSMEKSFRMEHFQLVLLDYSIVWVIW